MLTAFSSLRALALSSMNWPVAIMAFTLALTPFAVDVVRTPKFVRPYHGLTLEPTYQWFISLGGISGTNFPIVGCGSTGSFTLHQTLMSVYLSQLQLPSLSLTIALAVRICSLRYLNLLTA